MINLSKFLKELTIAGVRIKSLQHTNRDGIYATDATPEYQPDATDADRVLFDQIKSVHDPHDYEADVRIGSEQQAENIPLWASWTEQQALTWHDANIKTPLDAATTFAQAKTVLLKIEAENRALLRMIIALRNNTWPGLQK